MTPARPERRDALGLALLGLIAGLAGTVDRFTGPPSDRHALILAALVAGVGLAAWRLTRRWDLAWLAAATAALWSIPYATPRQELWVAAVPIAVLLAPTGWLARLSDVALGLIAFFLAGGVAAWFTREPIAAAFAGVGAFFVTWMRPGVPTRQTIGAFRTGSLLAPGLVLILLMAANAGTGWFEQPSAKQALWLGIGLAGLLVLVALAGLGLTTLLESDDPGQRSAWLASALGLVVLVVSASLRDVETLRAAGAHAVGPIAVLACLTAARLEEGGLAQPLAYAIPLVASVTQMGL